MEWLYKEAMHPPHIPWPESPLFLIHDTEIGIIKSPHLTPSAHAPASLMFNLSVDSGRHLLNGWGEGRLYNVAPFTWTLCVGGLMYRSFNLFDYTYFLRCTEGFFRSLNDIIECKTFSLCILTSLRVFEEDRERFYSKSIWIILQVVCVTQNRLIIRRKNLCVHREDSKRHKTVYISVNNNTNFNVFRFFLSIYATVYGMD